MTLRNNAVTVKYVKQWERCACLHCIICSFLCLLVKLLKWVSQLQTRPSTLSFYLMCLCSCRQTARTSIIQRRFYHRCPDVDVLASRSTHSSSNWIELMMGVSLYGKLNNLKRKRKKCVTHAAVSEISDVVSLSASLHIWQMSWKLTQLVTKYSVI